MYFNVSNGNASEAGNCGGRNRVASTDNAVQFTGKRQRPTVSMNSESVEAAVLRSRVFGASGQCSMRRGWRVLFCMLLCCFAGLAASPDARADDPVVEAQVNVPYVVQFGFGSYDVGGLSTNTFRIPIAHTFPLGDERDSLKVKLTGYLGYSYADFETRVLGPQLTASQDYLFILSQAELQIPLFERWTVKPYLAAGGGWAFNGSVKLEGEQKQPLGDSYDFLYSAGVSSLFEIPVNRWTASFGARLGWAEEVALGGGRGQGFATMQTGVEVRHPIGITVAGHTLDLAGSFIYYYFFPAAQFTVPGEHSLEVSNQYEFGTTIGLANPTTLWIFDNPRIGASYRFGDGLTGFRINFGFPF